MNKMNWNSIFKIAVIFLLVTNVATIVTVRRIAKNNAEDSLPVVDLPRDARMGYFRGSLGLNEDQMIILNRYNADYNKRAADINRRLMSLRKRMIIEISGDKPDSSVIDSVLEEFGACHIELKRATIYYYNELQSICNDEQQHNLELFFRNMLDPQGPMYLRGPGRGGRGRMQDSGSMGQGRRFRNRAGVQR